MTSTVAMSRMISDLTDFSASSLGARMPLERSPMDLAELCHQVIEETRAGVPDRPLRLETRGDLAGEWDGARLRQVISNLLGNAVQHGEGAIDFSADGAGAAVVLIIQNSGPSIPEEALPNVFNPLVRARGPGTPGRNRAGSLGLGLYIAREIVVGHGGSIEIESSPEVGTVVTVQLPRTGAPV
jgi:signal transduction histidine kinase